MEQYKHDNYSRQGQQNKDIILHFVNGNLVADSDKRPIPYIRNCMATIYADEDIGIVDGSDIYIGYNDAQEVWIDVRNFDGSSFEWSNQETGREVVILFYLLTLDREYLLFSNNKKFFCYLAMPKRNPRQDHTGRIPNTHFLTNYWVLDELLQQSKKHLLKCNPRNFDRYGE